MPRFLNALGSGFLLIVGLLAGCGGGGSDTTAAAPASPASPTAPATPVAATTISGSVVKGPVDAARVTARAVNGGTILGTTTTSPNGTYSMTITHDGDVVLEVTGGNYIDEATGVRTPLNQLKAIVKSGSGTQTAHVTPLTYIAYGYSGVSSAGFNTALANLATQFGLGTTNLLTTLPAVSGTTNDYGRVLRGMSQYVRSQGLPNFEAFVGQALNPATLAAIQNNFSLAFTSINGSGSPLTFKFDGTGVSVGGTGAGGGSGTCGVNVTGNITAQGFNVPLNLNYCISGISAGSCSASNASLNQSLNGQGGVTGAANLNYTYSASCAAGAININLTP